MTVEPSSKHGIHRLGLIIPYRDREEHLATFIPHIQRFLENLPYDLIIIEQVLGKPFNRGKLLNIGYILAKCNCTYLCFHDVDMLPLQADYRYPVEPTHLATSVEQFGYDMPYPEYFGGVTLINTVDFECVNGYANAYWGWGREDDDLRIRCLNSHLKIASRPGIFLSLDHPLATKNPFTQANWERYEEFACGNEALSEDGIKTLSFKLIRKETRKGVFHYWVEI